MKQMMMALVILGCSCASAEAQTTKTPQLKNPVAKNNTITVNNGKTCKVTYGQNYKVCRSEDGDYYTCGTRPSTMTCTDPETGTHYTTTGNNDAEWTSVQHTSAYSAYTGKGKAQRRQPDVKTTTIWPSGVVTTTSTKTYTAQPAIAPESQSVETERTFTGNYPNQLQPVIIKGRADSINNANAPYHGKNSPQYDGVEKNKLRNLNTPPQSPNATFDGK